MTYMKNVTTVITFPGGETKQGAIREFIFFGKHLKPAPAHIEEILLRREAWESVYHTCRTAIDELLVEAASDRVDLDTVTDGLNWLNRIIMRACEHMEHYDECYMLEFTIDEDFSDA